MVRGSANYRVLPIPNLDLRYQRDKVFISARDGIGATLLDVSGFKPPDLPLPLSAPTKATAAISTAPATCPSRSRAVPSCATTSLLRRQGRTTARIGGSNGLIFDALLDGKLRLSDSVFLSGGPRLSVTDGTFNQAYFGITALQSINSGYAQYYPGAGAAQRRGRRERPVAHPRPAELRRLRQLQLSGRYRRQFPIVTGPGGSRNQFVTEPPSPGASPVEAARQTFIAAHSGRYRLGGNREGNMPWTRSNRLAVSTSSPT